MPEDYMTRLVLEAGELQDKINKLADFIESNPTFYELEVETQHLLVKQRLAMDVYLLILNTRIELDK